MTSNQVKVGERYLGIVNRLDYEEPSAMIVKLQRIRNERYGVVIVEVVLTDTTHLKYYHRLQESGTPYDIQLKHLYPIESRLLDLDGKFVAQDETTYYSYNEMEKHNNELFRNCGIKALDQYLQHTNDLKSCSYVYIPNAEAVALVSTQRDLWGFLPDSEGMWVYDCGEWKRCEDLKQSYEETLKDLRTAMKKLGGDIR